MATDEEKRASWQGPWEIHSSWGTPESVPPEWWVVANGWRLLAECPGRQGAELVCAAMNAIPLGLAFLAAYDNASVADEEGLLAAHDYQELRALWRSADEAAEAFRVALAAAVYTPPETSAETSAEDHAS